MTTTSTHTRADLEAFVLAVRAACVVTPPLGRTGNRTWTHAAYLFGPFRATMTLETFKSLLVEANHARLIDLSRCDMVEGYDPHDVRRSTVTANGAVFNFIRD